MINQKSIINSFIVCMLVFMINTGFAQERKKIYFLADTINVNKNDRVLQIASEGPATCFAFFCRCMPPYTDGNAQPLNFCYWKEQVNYETASIKPNINFISWRELSQIVSEVKNDFENKYELYITEVLPDHKYKTYGVRLTIYRERLQ